jgi:hypothetical protein
MSRNTKVLSRSLFVMIAGTLTAIAQSGEPIQEFEVASIRSADPNRMLKKSLTALLVETKARLYVSAYARNRYPAEFDVQLPVT